MSLKLGHEADRRLEDGEAICDLATDDGEDEGAHRQGRSVPCLPEDEVGGGLGLCEDLLAVVGPGEVRREPEAEIAHVAAEGKGSAV